ncbi:MAG: hypothetical protein ACLUQ0_03280 [Enterococcus italicus]|jgi:hypothetical protein|uniref:hypothetical protein n=1 Tax=Enterococcus italicus TaxID=246144 RepID=UPI00399465E5
MLEEAKELLQHYYPEVNQVTELSIESVLLGNDELDENYVPKEWANQLPELVETHVFSYDEKESLVFFIVEPTTHQLLYKGIIIEEVLVWTGK